MSERSVSRAAASSSAVRVTASAAAARLRAPVTSLPLRDARIMGRVVLLKEARFIYSSMTATSLVFFLTTLNDFSLSR
ncbi:hypothetical protein PO909_025077 [Leuciscus waleckii]